jgi:hypothetical protein
MPMDVEVIPPLARPSGGNHFPVTCREVLNMDMFFYRIIQAVKIFFMAIILASFFAYFGKKIDFQNQINLVNSGQVPELSLLVFMVAITLPVAVMVFWPILVKSDKIYLNLSSPIELTRWRAAAAVSIIELLIMAVVL